MRGEDAGSVRSGKKGGRALTVVVPQVCPGEPAGGLLLPLLRRVDVWGHHVGDVHLLRGALVRPVGQAGTPLPQRRLSFSSARRPSGVPALSCLPPSLQILWRVEREGERLEKPPDCPQELYGVMRKCWMCNPNDRPNFTQLGVLVAEVGASDRFDPAVMPPFRPHPWTSSTGQAQGGAGHPGLFRTQETCAGSQRHGDPGGPQVGGVDPRVGVHLSGPLFLLVYSFVGLGSLEMSEWRGQNQRTLSVGWFPASLTMPPPPAPAPQTVAAAPPPSSSGAGPGPGPASLPIPVPVATSSFISTPLRGSLQHTGHGDLHPERGWGTPEKLDESVVLRLSATKRTSHRRLWRLYSQ